ncbi:MAG: PASTA domain-containing protein [Dysgonomonas sp.]
MAVVFFVIIIAVLFWLNSYTRHNQSITVPSLKGLQVEDAAAIIKSSNLNYEVVDSIYEKRGVPGSILEQVPEENAKIKEDRTVYLIVQAKAEQLVSIPDLADYSQRQAEALLNALGFTNLQIEPVPSAYRGLVVSVEYKGVAVTAGQKIPKGSMLRLKVGDGLTSETDSINTSNTNNIDPDFQ